MPLPTKPIKKPVIAQPISPKKNIYGELNLGTPREKEMRIPQMIPIQNEKINPAVFTCL